MVKDTVIGTFLTTRCAKERWIRLHDPERLWNTDVKNDIFTEDSPSAIYYASFLGLDQSLLLILSISTADINAPGDDYGNALQAASYRGYEKVVQILAGANLP